MGNKLIFIGLWFALVQATRTKVIDPVGSLDDGPLTIYVDAGKDIEHFLSLVKTIEGKQNLIDTALERMSAKIEALEERMSVEISRLNQRANESSKQHSTYSPDVAIHLKRPAELACERITIELNSIGESIFKKFPDYLFKFNTTEKIVYCSLVIIDKRFLLSSAECLLSKYFTNLALFFSLERKEIKTFHLHPNYTSKTATLNNIGLIELKSDINYTDTVFPVCLHASQTTPEKFLMTNIKKVQIVSDSNCLVETLTELQPTQMCFKGSGQGCRDSGQSLYSRNEKNPKYRLFGIVGKTSCNDDPFVITKVFDHLDFIESIVWPKSDI